MSGVALHPTIPAILSILVLLVFVAVGRHVLGRVRRAINTDDTNAADLLGNFEEMRREGDISEAEFRTINSVLGKK